MNTSTAPLAPLVSIALCSYNTGPFLQPLLESLLNQTWRPIEIVCCDDGSTDGTRDILAKFVQDHPALVRLYLNEENIGYIKNFEKALSLCKGKYIAIADHDDIWKANKVQALVENIGDNLLMYSDSEYIDEKGMQMNRQLTTKFNLHNHPDPRSFIFGNTVWGHSVLLKASLLEYALPIPAEAPYDTWLGFVAANVGSVGYLPQVLTSWRQHENSFSSIFYDKKQKHKNTLFEEWKKNLQWIRILKNFKHNRHPAFFSTLEKYFGEKNERAFAWPLFFFLVKNHAVLLNVWRRSAVSRINEFRKMARGVRERK
jgi:glycosyltransferase involved in cell wall biosynthesis